jgi:hypothetical protein
MDPYFDKDSAGPQPRPPLISTWAVVMLCGTALCCALLWFAHVEPKMAMMLGHGFMQFLGGCALVIVALFFLLLR